MNVASWVLQIVLAAVSLGAGLMKSTQRAIEATGFAVAAGRL